MNQAKKLFRFTRFVFIKYANPSPSFLQANACRAETDTFTVSACFFVKKLKNTQKKPSVRLIQATHGFLIILSLLYVELKQHDVAVAHNVIFALRADFTRFPSLYVSAVF